MVSFFSLLVTHSKKRKVLPSDHHHGELGDVSLELVLALLGKVGELLLLGLGEGRLLLLDPPRELGEGDGGGGGRGDLALGGVGVVDEVALPVRLR